MKQKTYKLKVGEEIKNVTFLIYFPLDVEEDKETFRNNIQQYWDFLQEAYHGDFRGCASRSDFKKKCSEIKIVMYNDEMIAISIYNRYAGGNKCVGLGASRKTKELHEIGREAVKRIIGIDFELPTKWYWIEASGRIEDFCKESNAIPIPSEFVPMIIMRRDFQVVDKMHYKMTLQNGSKIIKQMFGIKDKETFELIKNYYTEKNENLKWLENNPTLEGKTYEYRSFKSKEDLVKGVLDYFIDLYVEDNLRELPPGMMKKYDDYIQKMTEIVKTQKNHPNIKNFTICLQDAVKCRKRMTVFEVHRA